MIVGFPNVGLDCRCCEECISEICFTNLNLICQGLSSVCNYDVQPMRGETILRCQVRVVYGTQVAVRDIVTFTTLCLSNMACRDIQSLPRCI